MSDSPGPWSERGPIIADLIKGHDADIVFVNEAARSEVRTTLDAAMPGHTPVHLRGGLSIYLRSTRFEILTARDWQIGGIDQTRYLGWVEVLDRFTGRTKNLLHTHLPHGDAKQREAAIDWCITRVASTFSDPIVWTGDFNNSLRTLAESPRFELERFGLNATRDKARVVVNGAFDEMPATKAPLADADGEGEWVSDFFTDPRIEVESVELMLNPARNLSTHHSLFTRLHCV